nr:hypothetical protein [uncultured Devosia sp.]
MDQPDKLTVTITGDQAERIRESVARGEFESPEHYVTAAIETAGFIHDDHDLPEWLPDTETLKRLVNEALDDPRPGLSSEEMRAEIDRWVAETEAQESAKINKAG